MNCNYFGKHANELRNYLLSFLASYDTRGPAPPGALSAGVWHGQVQWNPENLDFFCRQNIQLKTDELEFYLASVTLLQHFAPDISWGGGNRPAEVGGEKQRPQGAPGIF